MPYQKWYVCRKKCGVNAIFYIYQKRHYSRTGGTFQKKCYVNEIKRTKNGTKSCTAFVFFASVEHFQAPWNISNNNNHLSNNNINIACDM